MWTVCVIEEGVQVKAERERLQERELGLQGELEALRASLAEEQRARKEDAAHAQAALRHLEATAQQHQVCLALRVHGFIPLDPTPTSQNSPKHETVNPEACRPRSGNTHVLELCCHRFGGEQR